MASRIPADSRCDCGAKGTRSDHNAPLDDLNIPGVPGNIDFDVPDLNAVDDIVPNINVPNVNLPNINPGHVGRPGRGR